MAVNEGTKTMHFLRKVSFFKPEKSSEKKIILSLPEYSLVDSITAKGTSIKLYRGGGEGVQKSADFADKQYWKCG